MKQSIGWISLIILFCTACGVLGATTSNQPGPSETVENNLAIPNLTSTAIETVRPTLELPTLAVTHLAIESWFSQPTYPESQPGFLSRLEYDPTRWAETENELGLSALVQRLIPYCVITPTGGHGLPLDWTVDQTSRTIGPINYEIVTVSQGGQVKYVNYIGRDDVIVTGFQVSFEDQMEDCLNEAEIVLSTLTSALDSEIAPEP